ncbi:MAG: 50S ribosomal protein L21 [Planctomycetaceae bacterium]|jgi:large subunit ribosomal protein L21|nr:50S ribosomal protein L21 [Planctomycetaceae bacterium]
MYAIIEDGGRQLKVEQGQELLIDYREDLDTNNEVVFDKVLAYCAGNAEVKKEEPANGGVENTGTENTAFENTVSENVVKIGQPIIAGAKVTAMVIGNVKCPKLTIQWFRRRKNSRKKTGHRQIHTKVKILKIEI